MPLGEADTRAKLIDPGLHARGWTEDLVRREETAGAIEIVDGRPRRQARGRVDYTLRVKVNLDTQPVAVALIEAKAEHLPPTHGLEQAKAYAACKRLNVRFAFSSNGHLFVEYDCVTGLTGAPRPLVEVVASPHPQSGRGSHRPDRHTAAARGHRGQPQGPGGSAALRRQPQVLRRARSESGTGRRIGSVRLDKSKLTGRKPQFRAGDIVYGYLRPYLNKIWVAEFDGLCSVDQYVYVVNRSEVDPNYLAWFMRSPVYLARAPINSGPGQLPRIRTEEVASVELDLPPLHDQRRIAAILAAQMRKVEVARAAAKVRLAAAQALFAAYLRTTFASVEGATWRMSKLADIAEVTGGIQETPNRAPRAFHRPYLTVRNVQQGFLDLSIVGRFEISHDELNRFRLRSGDILIVEGNGSRIQIGRNAVFADDGHEWVHQNHIIRVRLLPDTCLPDFVGSFFNSPVGRGQMLEKARTTSVLYTLSAEKVASLEVPVPPMAEQRRIVTRLTTHLRTTKQLCTAATAELSTVEALPATLLQRAFSAGL